LLHTPDELAAFLAKLVKHLESALAITDQTRDGAVGYLVATALDTLRRWPETIDSPPRPVRR
jgi:hypothetical protein